MQITDAVSGIDLASLTEKALQGFQMGNICLSLTEQSMILL